MRPAAHARDRVGQQRLVLAALLDGERREVVCAPRRSQLDRDARQQERVLAGAARQDREVDDAATLVIAVALAARTSAASARKRGAIVRSKAARSRPSSSVSGRR